MIAVVVVKKDGTVNVELTEDVMPLNDLFMC
jgi:hypothetical protein